MSTCDDRPVPKPATGKTPVRNARIPDEVWLPAIARAEMEGRTATEALTEALRDYAFGDDAPSYHFTFANWPQAHEWVRTRIPALTELNRELGSALGWAGTEWIEWLGVAVWLGSTHHPADPEQQKRVIAGHILRRFDYASVRDRFRDTRHLSETVQSILERHLPLAEG